MKHLNVPEVGAPDPTLETSPIIGDDDDDRGLVDPEPDTDACYFNGQRFDIGAYVSSGSELLYCDAGGVWVRRGESYR